MKDIIIERLKNETDNLKKRYTNWTNLWFPKKEKENKLSENHDVWYKIMVSNYDK